jgi:hypothetical protein
MKNQIKQISKVLVLAMVAMSVVACNQGRNAQNTATPVNSAWTGGMIGPQGMIQQPGMFQPNMWPGGAQQWPGQSWNTGGVMQQGPLASAYGQAPDGSMGLGLLFYSAGGASQIVAQGELLIGQAGYSQFCPLFPGRYQVSSQGAGMAQGNQVGNLRLEAAAQTQMGIVQIYLTLVQANVAQGVRMGPSGQQYGASLLGQVFVQGVVINGQQYGCQQELANIVLSI